MCHRLLASLLTSFTSAFLLKSLPMHRAAWQIFFCLGTFIHVVRFYVLPVFSPSSMFGFRDYYLAVHWSARGNSDQFQTCKREREKARNRSCRSASPSSWPPLSMFPTKAAVLFACSSANLLLASSPPLPQVRPFKKTVKPVFSYLTPIVV